LPDLQPHSPAMGQKDGEKWTAAVDSQPMLPKPDRLLVLDGVYRRTDGEPVFVEVPAPTDKALQALLHKIIARLIKLLTRRGVLVEEEGSGYLADGDADSDDARALRPLQAAAWPCRPRRAARWHWQSTGLPVSMLAPAPRQAQTVHRTVCAWARPIELPSDRAPGAGQRKRAVQRCWAGSAQAQDRLARRHPAHPDVAAAVHAAPGGAGATATATPEPFGARVTSLREVSGPPLREPWRAGAEREATRAGGAAGARCG